MQSPSYSKMMSASKSRRQLNRSGFSILSSSTARRSGLPGGFDSPTQALNFSFQMPVLDENTQHTILPYGVPLPVLVTEAFTERLSDISVKLEDSGWASLVSGRRLLVWKFKQDASKVMICRELTLPQSGLAHKADLVQISVGKESQMPSALAVSPEGIVRYWPNIIHEGFSTEASTDTSGQECFSLTSIEPLGFIIATTTCSLILITPIVSDGQHTVICRTLKFPQSVLAGIGKRVSSFIFGGLPSQASETKQLIKVLSSVGNSKDSSFLFVLSGSSLQKWCLTEDEPDQLVFEQDLDRPIKEHVLHSICNCNDATQIHRVRNWCLDMQLTTEGVVVLLAAYNPPLVYYALCFVDVYENSAEISSFQVLNHSESYQIDNEEKILSWKFIFPSKNSQIAYLYNNEKVIFVQISDCTKERVLVDSSSTGYLLGTGIWEGSPLLLTHFHGLLLLQYNRDVFLDATFHSIPPPKELIMKEQSSGEASDSLHSKLTSAMCLYYNKETDKCQEIVNEAFSSSSMLKMDSELDITVVQLSKKLIDDYPVSDPRWCETVSKGDSISSSLIILHQLEDKVTAHNYFINFLKAVGLYSRLTTVPLEDRKVPTKVVLCEHAEKLQAAKVIRKFVVDYAEVLDPVIKETLEARNVELQGRLTFQDMFFREVSEVHTLFKFLIEYEERSLADEVHEIINLVSMVNNVFAGVNAAVLQFRESTANLFQISQTGATMMQCLLWTSAEGPVGMRTLLLRQHSINMQYMVKASEDIQVQGMIFQQIVDIINIVLEGYWTQLESVKECNNYESLEEKFSKERNKLIRPLLGMTQYERAASLAERYLDFDVLVQLCEDTNNKDRLQRYVIQFKEQGFSDFMFKWYLDKGMRNRLLEQPVGQQEELARFLQQHNELSWVHNISKGNYKQAQKTLQELALSESNYLSKKKTLLSLSKLAALASDLPPDAKHGFINELNAEQDLIVHQENLPDAVVEAFDLDPDTMRVRLPEELIEMYISEENTDANAYDFKIALELLQFIKKPPGDAEHENLRMHVWCKALLRDNWEELDTNNPLESIKETLFFQLIELAFDQGVDLYSFIIPVHDLLQCPEINSLSDNPNFTFLIRAGYEQIYKLLE